MIRPCQECDFEAIYAVVNDGAQAYKGVIPPDCWQEPYMPQAELREEIGRGVRFWGQEDGGGVFGVMGIEDVADVTLIRHAYVRTEAQRRGIGSELLSALRERIGAPLLVGTWAAAVWAVRFYERRGFRLVTEQEKDRLLAEYWTIPGRQIETSVVLADAQWFHAGE